DLSTAFSSNTPPTTVLSTLSLHDALPIWLRTANLNPTVVTGEYRNWARYAGTRASPIEICQRNATPAELVVIHRGAGLHAHHHGGVLLDFADLAKLDLVGEARHQRGIHAGAAQVAGTEAREEKEEQAAGNHCSGRHANDCSAERAGEGALSLVWIRDLRGHCVSRAAPQFERSECGDSKQQIDEKENEKRCVDRENRGSENSGKRKHCKKKCVTVGRGAVEANQRDVEKKMHRGKETAEQRGIRRTGREHSREYENIKRKKCE